MSDQSKKSGNSKKVNVTSSQSNPHYPWVIHANLTTVSDLDKTLTRNGWERDWTLSSGFSSENHWHTVHEVVVLLKGDASVRLGGQDGVVLHMTAGDLLLLPAGTAHQGLDEKDAESTGAYVKGVTTIDGQVCDWQTVEMDETKRDQIARLAPPVHPLTGEVIS